MKHIKKQEEFTHLDEMAKGFPPGKIIKVSNPDRLGFSEHRDWNTFRPTQASGAEGGLFYMEIKESGRVWLEGPILYGNCLINSGVANYKARVATASAEEPGDEYRIFKKNDDKIKAVMKKAFFLDGSEKGIMSNDGKAASISEAEYIASGLNFKLSDLYDEPVIFLLKKGSTSASCNIKLSDIDSLTKELSSDQKAIISEWFSKELKADVTVEGDKFTVAHYTVKGPDRGAYPGQISAGPFINKEQAQKFVDMLKSEKTTLYNPNSIKIEADAWSKTRMELEEMIKYAKTVGIATTMKELLALKKGAVAGRKFGI